MRRRVLLFLVAVIALALPAFSQTAVWMNPPWSVSLGGTDWSGHGCLNGNQPGWMWGYVTKAADGTVHVKMDYCDGATQTWQTIVWDNAAAPTVQFADAETPAGTIDGKNTAFTLAHAPQKGSVPIVSRNGMLQRAGGDYTLAGNTLTFARAPEPGDVLQVWYRY